MGNSSMVHNFSVETRKVTKIYRTGMQELKALNNVSLTIERGDFVAFMGPSGSGKSTLMNLIGCLDRPTSGDILLDGVNVSNLEDDQLADIRGQKIGFIFQKFNLVPTMNALKNVEIPMIFRGVSQASREKVARDLLKKLGLENWATHLPSELSGGQQQRVAVARALANNPEIILADEPTGNLDTKTGEQVMNLLSSIATGGKTILLVTHDPNLKKYVHRVILMKDGKISEAS